MLLQFTPLFFASLAVTALLVVITIMTWRFRSLVLGRTALAIMVCASVYSLLNGLSIASVDPAVGGFLVVLQLLPRIFLPVLFFLFVLVYIGEIGRITPLKLSLAFCIPVIVLVFAFTSPYHPLFVTDVSAQLAGEFMTYSFTPGPVFWINGLYSFSLVIAGISLAVSRFVRSPLIYRIQIAMVLMAFAMPYFIHMVLLFTPFSEISVLLFQLSFALSALAIYIATSRYQLLTLTPVAFPVLFSHMTDGVIITNPEGLVVDVNPAAARITGRERGTIIGSLFSPLLPDTPEQDLLNTNTADGPLTITLPLDGKPRYYDLRTIPLCGPENDLCGTIILLHDSHTRHMTELSLRKANEKLQLLTSITRHDILNTLTVLMGTLQLSRISTDPKKTGYYLSVAEDQAGLLRNQIEFTSDYQTLGLSSAQWQNVKEAIDAVLPAQAAVPVYIDPGLAGIRLFADPMFGRVFYNLFENSLRYGGTLNEIRIFSQLMNRYLILIYEDNGCGIPEVEKERIFEKGYGNNTGLGLFLAREILALTGIAIIENGIPGKGARFEIRVPDGMYTYTVDKER
jgi:signal transduction histidine kinase